MVDSEGDKPTDGKADVYEYNPRASPSLEPSQARDVVPFPVPLFSGDRHENVSDFLLSADFAFQQQKVNHTAHSRHDDLHSLIIRTNLRGSARDFVCNLPYTTRSDPKLLEQALTQRFLVLKPGNLPKRMKSVDGMTRLCQHDGESLERYLERAVEISDNIDSSWDSEFAERFVGGIQDESVWVLVCSIVFHDATTDGFSFQTAVEAVNFAIRALCYRKRQRCCGNEKAEEEEDQELAGKLEQSSVQDNENSGSELYEGSGNMPVLQSGPRKKKSTDCNTPPTDGSESGIPGFPGLLGPR